MYIYTASICIYPYIHIYIICNYCRFAIQPPIQISVLKCVCVCVDGEAAV